eukprot:6213713-Pleurochrysis_carterae.AAC.4
MLVIPGVERGTRTTIAFSVCCTGDVIVCARMPERIKDCIAFAVKPLPLMLLCEYERRFWRFFQPATTEDADDVEKRWQ